MTIEANLVTFRAKFPEFSSVPDATVEIELEETNGMLSSTSWGNCVGLASLYLAAHNIALRNNRLAQTVTDPNGNVITTASSGVVNSTSADGLSAGFTSSLSQTAGNDNQTWLQLTQYGQAYAALKRRCLSQGYVVRSACPIPFLGALPWW